MESEGLLGANPTRTEGQLFAPMTAEAGCACHMINNAAKITAYDLASDRFRPLAVRPLGILPLYFAPRSKCVAAALACNQKPDGPARWLGAWAGTYGEDRRDLMVVVETAGADTATNVYATGAGPKQDQNMGFERFTKARLEGNTLAVNRSNRRTITLTLSADGKSIAFQHKSENSQPLVGSLTQAN